MATSKPGRMRRFRLVLWGLVAIAAVGATMLFLYRPGTQAVEAFYARPFELIDQDGQIVTEAAYLGKPSVWFYGFTHCPDVCPTALAEMSAILEALGPAAGKVQVVFVSVDPERDTTEIMKEYVEYFDPRIDGLTGSLERVSAMVKDRYIFFEKVPMEGGDYQLEHQATIQLVDAQGQFFGTLASEESFDIRLAKVRRLIGS